MQDLSVNKGNATAKDVLELIEYIKQEVYKKFNVEIEPEIDIISCGRNKYKMKGFFGMV